MPDWDRDNPRLRENLASILREIVHLARDRDTLNLEIARRWHALMMEGLDVPDRRFVSAFRGEPGLENVQVKVGRRYGVEAAMVAGELANFEAKLHDTLDQLDALLPADEEPDADQLAAVIDLCAWAHSEWVRIHPFANGNGRIARLWANSLAIRYGLPPFIRLRPRPNSDYALAGAKAMDGDWKPTARIFRRMLEGFLSEPH